MLAVLTAGRSGRHAGEIAGLEDWGIGISSADEQPEWATSWQRHSNHGGIRRAHVRLPTTSRCRPPCSGGWPGCSDRCRWICPRVPACCSSLAGSSPRPAPRSSGAFETFQRACPVLSCLSSLRRRDLSISISISTSIDSSNPPARAGERGEGRLAAGWIGWMVQSDQLSVPCVHICGESPGMTLCCSYIHTAAPL